MKTITIEASEELAKQIAALHSTAEHIQSHAIDGINDLIRARIDVATLAETAQANLGAGYHKWWRDQGLPDLWDHKYIRIAKSSKGLALTDKCQMRLIGIIPDEETDADEDGMRGTKREPNPFAWIKFAGKVRASLTMDQIKGMSTHEKETARLHLKPMVELYEALNS